MPYDLKVSGVRLLLITCGGRRVMCGKEKQVSRCVDGSSNSRVRMRLVKSLPLALSAPNLCARPALRCWRCVFPGRHIWQGRRVLCLSQYVSELAVSCQFADATYPAPFVNMKEPVRRRLPLTRCRSAFLCVFFRRSGVFYWSLLLSVKFCACFLRHAEIRFLSGLHLSDSAYIWVLLLATSTNLVLVGRLWTLLKTKIFEIAYVITISAKKIFRGVRYLPI